MEWWREARFGLFIHWGLYAIPAGEWNGETWHGEWIRTTAQIPLETYDQFLGQFDPVKFNADEWVKMAKAAGMKYIVITSKHHDGFCLFDSPYTDFDVMSTPFQRDILKELSAACEKEGIRLCFYHSIMDWHHPDYIPRRGWEKDRGAEGADFERFITYLKNQVQHLVVNYGDLGVLWFDGEWEDTWTHEHGVDMYNFVRSLDSSIIINNRVDKGREGMAGMTAEGGYMGDFGTPEQEIPATGIPGTDWESCMTMNDHWGYNKYDNHWKSTKELIRNLIDIASKGGNFLLNVGPTAEGLFPEESVERLKEMGKWMASNGESIYGTSASPFKSLGFGRCTQKPVGKNTILYFHIFDWPEKGILKIKGLDNAVRKAYIPGPGTPLKHDISHGAILIDLSAVNKDEYATVIALEIKGDPVVYNPPVIHSTRTIFIDSLMVTIDSDPKNTVIRYTLDGNEPEATSMLYEGPFFLKEGSSVTAQSFKDGSPFSDITRNDYQKVDPIPPYTIDRADPTFGYKYFEGDWNELPDFSRMKPRKTGTANSISLEYRSREEYYGFLFEGFIAIPERGVYRFSLGSDDGSRLTLDDIYVLDNDGLHGMVVKTLDLPLEQGIHKLKVEFFEKSGDDDLVVTWDLVNK